MIAEISRNRTIISRSLTMSANSGYASWIKVMPAKKKKSETKTPVDEAPAPETHKLSQWIYQNTDTVVWTKPKTPERKMVARHQAANNQGNGSQVSQYHRQVENLVDGDAPLKKKLYPASLRNRLLKTRQTMGLNQAQMALKVSIDKAIIKGIENNTAVYDPKIMQKLSDHLDKMK